MNIKTGDNVIILSGSDKGKVGKVAHVFPREDKVVVEGVNIKKRHRKANKEGGKGSIVETAYPIHVSNVRVNEKVEKSEEKPKKASTKAPKTTKVTV